jgi:bacteriocin biosynthesis cyclodehydratase domain-containing protein
MANPHIRRNYSVIGHTPDNVELRYGVWNPISLTLTDDTQSGYLFRILTALDGTSSVAEIARQLGLERDDVEAVLDQLRDLGALEETGPRSTLDYYLDNVTPGFKSLEFFGQDRFSSVLLLGDDEFTDHINRHLQDSLPAGVSVGVISKEEEVLRKIVFDPDTSWLMDGHEFHERMELFEPWRRRLIVLATKTISPIAARTLNRVALHHGIPWLHAALDGPFVLVGPFFIPGRSSCYECFETRVAMNLREQASYQRYKNALVAGQVKGGTLPLHSALVGLIAAHVAMETLNYVYTGGTFTAQKLMAIYLPTMETAFNDVLRLPGCPACGSQSERDDKELFFGFEMLTRPQATNEGQKRER